MKVLFIRKISEELKTYLKKGLQDYPDIELVFPDKKNEKELIELAENVKIIVGWRPTEKLLNYATKFKLFINPGAGVQHLIDLFRKINQKRDITLVNGHGNSYFTAQHGVALLLSLMNKIIPHHNWMKEGKWRLGDSDARSLPLRNRKIGFLGYGNVNRNIHKMLLGFDISFAALKREWPENKFFDIIQYKRENLSGFLKYIDVLFCTVPLTSYTKNMIGMPELKLLGKDGILINLSRGAVINEKDLFEALQKKIISAAAIDVWYNYQPEPDEKGRKFPTKYPFYELVNVILSPHRAASPFNDLQRWDEVIDNISRFAQNRTDFLNVVNLHNEY